jgi:hypothetical protein
MERDLISRAALDDKESAPAELDQRDGFPVPNTLVTSSFGKTARYATRGGRWSSPADGLTPGDCRNSHTGLAVLVFAGDTDRMAMKRVRRTTVMALGAVVVVASAGFAAARTTSGPPWMQKPDESFEEITDEERAKIEANVNAFFDAAGVEGECNGELLGGSDEVEGALGDDATVETINALVTSLVSGQTSHMVQGTRSILENCADHPNDGLRNALYHHGLNWIRHYEHEQWLREKFQNKWPDGKPGGNPHVDDGTTREHGNPHATNEADGGPGSGHGGASSNGNAYGHSK